MPFELQGHRGARGLIPENTLPSFEAALEAGVSSIETDLHLTRDGHVVLFHDDRLTESICEPPPVGCPRISDLTLAEVQRFRACRNPDPRRFPNQQARVTPLVPHFIDAYPFFIPTLTDLIAFIDVCHAGELAEMGDKSVSQRDRAACLRYDLELKHAPFFPEDQGKLEERVVEILRGNSIVDRTTVRSFDHRAVKRIKELEPRLTAAVLITGTAPVDPVRLTQDALANVYCPDYHFLDEAMVKQLHAAGIRVLPWTVNDPQDWQRLVDWGVDGITTDYPDQLAAWLRERNIEVM